MTCHWRYCVPKGLCRPKSYIGYRGDKYRCQKFQYICKITLPSINYAVEVALVTVCIGRDKTISTDQTRISH